MSTTYEVRVKGHLDDHWSTWFGELDLARHHDGTTTLVVEAGDQTQLHGLLAELRNIGAILVELRTIETPTTDRNERDRTPRSGGESGIDDRPRS